MVRGIKDVENTEEVFEAVLKMLEKDNKIDINIINIDHLAILFILNIEIIPHYLSQVFNCYIVVISQVTVLTKP